MSPMTPPDGRWTYEGLARAALAAPPSPAEPPLDLEVPTHDHDSYMHSHGGPRHIHRAEARPPEGLDEAWAAAEAALPDGYRFTNLNHMGGHPRTWHATANATPAETLSAVTGTGPTPAAALHALAAHLSARGAEPQQQEP